MDQPALRFSRSCAKSCSWRQRRTLPLTSSTFLVSAIQLPIHCLAFRCSDSVRSTHRRTAKDSPLLPHFFKQSATWSVQHGPSAATESYRTLDSQNVRFRNFSIQTILQTDEYQSVSGLPDNNPQLYLVAISGGPRTSDRRSVPGLRRQCPRKALYGKPDEPLSSNPRFERLRETLPTEA